jgi:hypothetical protein
VENYRIGEYQVVTLRCGVTALAGFTVTLSGTGGLAGVLQTPKEFPMEPPDMNDVFWLLAIVLAAIDRRRILRRIEQRLGCIEAKLQRPS